MKTDDLETTLKRLRLFGLLARIDEIRNKPWLEEVLAIELEEKTRRSLAHRRTSRASAHSSRSAASTGNGRGRSTGP